ncbi:hypothetical protein KBC99_01205 [Candidatus Saccharibacteria bacterium]|nr:hypothetical protein [Candidatus Saccharibacteria bacterium]
MIIAMVHLKTARVEDEQLAVRAAIVANAARTSAPARLEVNGGASLAVLGGNNSCLIRLE